VISDERRKSFKSLTPGVARFSGNDLHPPVSALQSSLPGLSHVLHHTGLAVPARPSQMRRPTSPRPPRIFQPSGCRQPVLVDVPGSMHVPGTAAHVPPQRRVVFLLARGVAGAGSVSGSFPAHHPDHPHQFRRAFLRRRVRVLHLGLLEGNGLFPETGRTKF